MSAIDGYENYVIFEDGKVINTITGKEKKSFLKKNGYYTIQLCKNNKQKYFLLHRLLAITFIPNPDNKKEVDHINRIKTDNRIENLRWASRSDQQRNKNCYTSTGFQYIYKQINKECKQGFIYQFQIQRPELKYNKTSLDLEKVIKFRNEFCLEHNIEINDTV